MTTALQEELLDSGVAADHSDAPIAASARERGTTFARAERHSWRDEVRPVLSVPEDGPGGRRCEA